MELSCSKGGGTQCSESTYGSLLSGGSNSGDGG